MGGTAVVGDLAAIEDLLQELFVKLFDINALFEHLIVHHGLDKVFFVDLERLFWHLVGQMFGGFEPLYSVVTGLLLDDLYPLVFDGLPAITDVLAVSKPSSAI